MPQIKNIIHWRNTDGCVAEHQQPFSIPVVFYKETFDLVENDQFQVRKIGDTLNIWKNSSMEYATLFVTKNLCSF